MASTFHPGFQQSETTRVEVSVYPTSFDPGFRAARRELKPLHFFGPETKSGEPVVTRVGTRKVLGDASGTFAIDVKAATGSNVDLLDFIVDDDWIDISITRHGKPTHVMRGLIDGISRSKSVNDRGATVVTYRIVGRDFGKIFESTTIWFDLFTDGAVSPAAIQRALEANGAFPGDPKETVESILAGLLVELGKKLTVMWPVPPSITRAGARPEDAALRSFELSLTPAVDQIAFFSQDFSGAPIRTAALNWNLFAAEETDVWALALQWADLPMCELYTELLLEGVGVSELEAPGARPHRFGRQIIPLKFEAGSGTRDPDRALDLTTKNSVETVVFRDRPFITSNRIVGGHKISAAESPWFRLPLSIIPPQHIKRIEVARSGLDRRNIFFAMPAAIQELSGRMISRLFPVMNVEDIRDHGFRRHEVTSQYAPFGQEADVEALATQYRDIIRDFHCMNHLFMNGVVELGYMRPDIRIGTRLQIAHSDPRQVETYYVEFVQHDWSLGTARTTIGVSRGFRGTDSDLLATFARTTEQFSSPLKVEKTATPPPAPLVLPSASAPPPELAPSLILTLPPPPVPRLVDPDPVTRILGYQTHIAQAADVFLGPFSSPEVRKQIVSILAGMMYIESSGIDQDGDGGHSHGLMQINDRDPAANAWVQSWKVGALPGFEGSKRDLIANIQRGAFVLAQKRAAMIAIGVPSARVLEAAVVAYNAGESTVERAFKRGLPFEYFSRVPHYKTRVAEAASVFLPLLSL